MRSKFNKVFKQEMNDTDLNRYSPHSHLNDSDDSNDLSEAEDYDSDLSGKSEAFCQVQCIYDTLISRIF